MEAVIKDWLISSGGSLDKYGRVVFKCFICNFKKHRLSINTNLGTRLIAYSDLATPVRGIRKGITLESLNNLGTFYQTGQNRGLK